MGWHLLDCRHRQNVSDHQRKIGGVYCALCIRCTLLPMLRSSGGSLEVPATGPSPCGTSRSIADNAVDL